MKKFLKNIYEVLFNSKLTALVCLCALGGLSVKGIANIIGGNEPCMVFAIILIVMLVNKVLNKVVE